MIPLCLFTVPSGIEQFFESSWKADSPPRSCSLDRRWGRLVRHITRRAGVILWCILCRWCRQNITFHMSNFQTINIHRFTFAPYLQDVVLGRSAYDFVGTVVWCLKWLAYRITPDKNMWTRTELWRYVWRCRLWTSINRGNVRHVLA